MAQGKLNKRGEVTYFKPRDCYYGRLPHNGKRIGVYRKTEEEAWEALEEMRRNIHDHDRPLDSKMLLKDYLTNYWLPRNKNKIKEKTYINYESFIRNHVIPRLGDISLSKLDSFHIIKAWEDMQRDGKNPRLIQSCHRVLTTALNQAIRKDNLIRNNPCSDAPPPRSEYKEMHFLTKKQIEQVLELAKNTDYHPLFHTAIYTGMRRNEMLALRWKDIDFDRKKISITKSLYVGKNGVIADQYPKTENSVRSIRIGETTARILKDLMDKQMDNLAKKNQQKDDDSLVIADFEPFNPNSRVFVRTHDRLTGAVMLPTGVSHAFKRMAKQLGIDDVRFHDLRHTHATHCFAETKDVQVIQRRLGHSKLSTTMDIYTHFIDNDREDEVVDKLEEALDTFSKQEIDGIEEAETLEKMWQK